MIDPARVAAWSALFLGLFAIVSALGELRRPGSWRKMVSEIEHSPALQLVIGMVEFGGGIALYLANGWNPQDWLACIMKIVGGMMIIEAMVVAAFSDIYLHFWMRALGRDWRGWALVSLLLGAWMTIAGLWRLI